MKIDHIDSDIKTYGTYKTHPKSTTYYVQTRSSYLHREIMERMLGRPLNRSEKVDHIDGDGTNNCRSNLRVCSHAENLANRGGWRNSSSKYKGVTFYKRDGNWQAKVCPKGKTLHLGYYNSEAEAALAYNYAAKHHFGSFAKLNEV